VSKPPLTATLTWQGDLKFRAATPRTEIILDSDSTAGPSPPEALMMALAGVRLRPPALPNTSGVFGFRIEATDLAVSFH